MKWKLGNEKREGKLLISSFHEVAPRTISAPISVLIELKLALVKSIDIKIFPTFGCLYASSRKQQSEKKLPKIICHSKGKNRRTPVCVRWKFNSIQTKSLLRIRHKVLISFSFLSRYRDEPLENAWSQSDKEQSSKKGRTLISLMIASLILALSFTRPFSPTEETNTKKNI